MKNIIKLHKSRTILYCFWKKYEKIFSTADRSKYQLWVDIDLASKTEYQSLDQLTLSWAKDRLECEPETEHKNSELRRMEPLFFLVEVWW